MIFFLIATLALFLMNYVVYRGFIMVYDFSSFWVKTLTFLLVIIFLLEVYFLVTFRNDIGGALYIVLASLIGISFMLFAITLLYDILFYGLHHIPFNPQRREVVTKMLNVTALIAIFAYLAKGFLGGFKKPDVKELHVKIDRLQKPLHIVQLTDVHIGKFLQKEFLEYIVGKVNGLQPDIVAITGDLVDLEINKAKKALKPLANLKSRYGVFYVPGNHEYYHGVESILKYLTSLNVKVLGNTNEQVAGVNIAGVYDMAAFRLEHPLKPSVDKALQGVDERLPTVLLAHQPKIVEMLKKYHGIDLILSGHTHGGQIFPFGFLVRLAQPYLHGLYAHNEKTQIYVSSGAGFWGPPIRFLSPSEIVSLKLS